MASCCDFEYLLSRQLDEPLSPEETAALHAHLETCPDCRALSDDLYDLHDAFTSLLVTPPDSLHTAILEKLKAEPNVTVLPVASRKKRMFRNVGVTAAALLIMISVLTFGSQNPVSAPDGDEGALLSHDTVSDAETTPFASPASEDANQAPVLPLEPNTESVENPSENVAPKEGTEKQEKPQRRSVAEPPPAPKSSRLETAPPPPAPADTEMRSPDTGQAQSDTSVAALPPENSAPYAFETEKKPLLSQEEAYQALEAYLSLSERVAPDITFKSLSKDETSFLFVVPDAASNPLEYAVSRTDGSVTLISAPNLPASTD